MKHLILFIIFFGVLLANAQEMDTTFVVNEQGQTVGIIHEKGTVPVVPQQQAAPTMQPQQLPAQANPAYDFDSTAYYQSLIDKYTTSGTKLRKAGNGMMIGGGIGAVVGLAMFIAGMSDAECTENEYGTGETCTTDNGLAVVGYLALLGGAGVFSTGLVIKIVGGSKLRKANRYNDMLSRYQMKQQYSMRLRLNPLVDPAKQNVGAKLALDF